MRKSFRSIIIVFVATAAFVSICFMMALVVNAAFRESVCAFFSITEPETIPQMTPIGAVNFGNGETGEPQINITDVIKGTYVHFPVQSSAKNGVFMVCADDVQMNSGNHYTAYYEKTESVSGLRSIPSARIIIFLITTFIWNSNGWSMREMSALFMWKRTPPYINRISQGMYLPR